MRLHTPDFALAEQLREAFLTRQPFTLTGAGVKVQYIASQMSTDYDPLPAVSLELQQVAFPVATTEWDGEGLPPVGTVCLLSYDNGGWGEALIKYMSETMCVWQWVRPEHEQQNVEWGQSPQHIEFQRIRTQEELLAEARENFIDELVQVTCIRRGEAGLIYDAGYRKVQP